MLNSSKTSHYRRHALVFGLAIAALIHANTETDTDTDSTNGCPAGNGTGTVNL